MRFGIIATFLAGTSLLAAGSAQAQATTAGSAEGDQPVPTAPALGNEGLQEIVVTAQRREESLQKVPVAVTAISAAQLDNLRVTNVKTLAGIAPGLQINTQGTQSAPTIIIRGISSGVSNNAVDPKVGVYLDGVYIGRTVGSIFDLADIQRVEVLRGPQGTLFGRNATGGAISLVTAPPAGELKLRGIISYGNYDARRGKVSLDLPAFGPFTVKLAYLHDQIDGDYHNSIGGRTLDLRPSDPSFGVLRYAKRLGGRNVDGGQVAIRGEFGAVTADYRFDYTDQRTVGRAMQNFGRLPDATGPIFAALDPLQAITGGTANLSTTRLTTVANATSEEHVVTQGHSVTLAVQATDNFLLKSITAYRRFRQSPMIYDLAATGGFRVSPTELGALFTGNIPQLFNPANAPGPNDSFFSLLTSRKTNQQQVSQELQGQLTNDAYSLTAGVFVFHEHSPGTDVLGILYPAVNGVANVNTNGAFGGGVTRTVAINNSFAGYAQLTLHLTDKLDVAAGARETLDDRRSKILSISVGQGGNLLPGTYDASYHKLTYTGIITYRPTAEINTYAKIATGYVSGGILSGIPYGPENLKSYEVGIKAQAFDNRLRFNLAGFYEQYKDLQVQEFVAGVQFFDNAGRANIKGFEAEVDATPIRGLVLSGNAGLADIDYKHFFSRGYPGLDLAPVARTAYASKWTARASAQYDAPEFSSGSHLYGRISGDYRSSYYLEAFPYTTGTTATGAPNPLTGTPTTVEQQNRRPGFWLISGRLGLADLAVSGAKFTLSAFGENLANKHYVGFGAPVEALTGTYERGRTYGVELGVNF